MFSFIHRIQDLDGGFFEKFGSLLRQKSEIAEEKQSTPLAPLPEDLSQLSDEHHLKTIEEGENDSGTETLPDTDSETEDQDQAKQEDLIGDLVGWNVSNIFNYCTRHF